MKNILVFSHAGVLDVNRAVFQELAHLYDVDLKMIVPTQWKGDLIRDLKFRPTSSDSKIQILPLPVSFSGNGSFFFYGKLSPAALKRPLGSWTPDFVFIDEEPWSLAAFQAARAFSGAKIAFFTKQNLRKRLPFPFNWIQKRVFNHSDLAFSVATEVSDVLRWKNYKKEIVSLPHSYDPALFDKAPEEERKRRRRKLSIAENAIVVGYFGRLSEEKGIDDFLEVIKMSRHDDDFRDVHYLVVGNGALETRLRLALESRNQARVTFLSAIPHQEVGKTLSLVDILVLPSRTAPQWKEQFGRILVEAMACGASVLGSDSGEIPFLIRRAIGGLVFKERDTHDFFKALKKLVGDPILLNTFKRNGYRYVTETLTHQRVALLLGEKIGLSPFSHSPVDYKSRETDLYSASL